MNFEGRRRAQFPSPRALLGVACVSAALSAASEARAYCQTRTCNPAEGECEEVDRCIVSGQALYWPNSCVSFSLQKDGSAKRMISFDTADSIVSAAFERWTKEVDCGGGRKPSLMVLNKGPVSCSTPTYNRNGPNANVWMFEDAKFPAGPGGHTLALTTVRYSPETGEIFDADVEINSAETVLTTTDTNVRADLASIVTHEAGHFLGLSHSNDAGATMWAGYMPREISMRQLAPDDVAGICAAYPAGRSVASDSCEPRRGFTPACSEEVVEATAGCSAAPGPGARGVSLLVILTAAAAVAAARRRTSPLP